MIFGIHQQQNRAAQTNQLCTCTSNFPLHFKNIRSVHDYMCSLGVLQARSWSVGFTIVILASQRSPPRTYDWMRVLTFSRKIHCWTLLTAELGIFSDRDPLSVDSVFPVMVCNIAEMSSSCGTFRHNVWQLAQISFPVVSATLWASHSAIAGVFCTPDDTVRRAL